MDMPTPAAGALPICMPAELLASTAFLLARLGFAVKAAAFEEFERAGASPYHYSILALLDEGARTTQAVIADALELDPSQLVGLLDALEERALVARRRDETDRRRHVVSLTEAGRRELEEFRTITAGVEHDFLSPLDDDARSTLHALLSQLAAHLDPRYVRTVVLPKAS
jgi:DNA-binding MarR family transcriptional regulator